MEGRRRGLLNAPEARAEWVNLMRYRLETDLGYRRSYGFTMKNTGGQEIYDMIFVTDHEAGDRIMRHLYGKAAREHEAMRRHALVQRRDRRMESMHGVTGLFPVSPDMVATDDAGEGTLYKPEPPHEPYALR